MSTNEYTNDPNSSTSYKQKTFFPTPDDWESGCSTIKVSTGDLPDTTSVQTKVIVPTVMGDPNKLIYEKSNEIELNNEEFKRTRIPNSVNIDPNIVKITSNNLWSDKNKKNELLNENRTLIQNEHDYPYYTQSSHDRYTAKYDYKVIPGDQRYPKMIKLEDKLKEARASFGIQVHGNNDIARAVKFNLYNRFKSPDQNLSFSKMSTHIFFTRPDLNLLDCSNGIIYGPNSQIKNHSDTSLLYKTDPYIFRILTDSSRCGDKDNFNWVLSNQIKSFDITDEELGESEVGKSWNGNSIVYGNSYNGKSTKEISCYFNELQDLSVIKMIKLWIMYIDNVSNGIWSPSYNLNGSGIKNMYDSASANSFGTSISDSYVYTKTLDYVSSIYVFKCGPNGDDILYWTKYYGVFPMNTGSSALSWDGNTIGSESSRLNIRFRYSFKRDLSPISLVEFNELSGIDFNSINNIAEESFNPSYNHSSRPYVGAPFVELSVPYGDENYTGNNSDMFGKPKTQIKLKFMKNNDNKLTDDLLYRNPSV